MPLILTGYRPSRYPVSLESASQRQDLAISAEEITLLIKLVAVLRNEELGNLGWGGYCNLCGKNYSINRGYANKNEVKEHAKTCWLEVLRSLQARPDYEGILMAAELRFAP